MEITNLTASEADVLTCKMGELEENFALASEAPSSSGTTGSSRTLTGSA